MDNDSIDDAAARIDVWQNQAEQNVENWGVQDAAQVTLAIAEENAEVAEEIQRRADADDDLEAVLDDVVEDGFDVRNQIETLFEDDDGTPVDDRPTATLDDEAIEELQDEVDDLGALVVQLQLALNELRDA